MIIVTDEQKKQIKEDFKALFPSMDNETVINSIIDIYPCFYNMSYSDKCCNKNALLFMLAHLYTAMSNPEDTTPNQVIASQSVGSVSMSFANGIGSSEYNNFFNTSKWGQMFLNMRCQTIGAFIV